MFGYRMQTANNTNIKEVVVTLYTTDSTGGSDNATIETYTDKFEGNGSSIIDTSHPLATSMAVSKIEFTIIPVDPTKLVGTPVIVELDGVFFQHKDHQATLTIQANGVHSFILPITP